MHDHLHSQVSSSSLASPLSSSSSSSRHHDHDHSCHYLCHHRHHHLPPHCQHPRHHDHDHDDHLGGCGRQQSDQCKGRYRQKIAAPAALSPFGHFQIGITYMQLDRVFIFPKERKKSAVFEVFQSVLEICHEQSQVCPFDMNITLWILLFVRIYLPQL